MILELLFVPVVWCVCQVPKHCLRQWRQCEILHTIEEVSLQSAYFNVSESWLFVATSYTYSCKLCGAVFHITGTFARPCPDYIFYRSWNCRGQYSKLCSTGTRSRPRAPRAGGIAALCQPTVGRSLHNHRRDLRFKHSLAIISTYNISLCTVYSYTQYQKSVFL